MHRRNVVLPEPDGPMTSTTSPCRTSSEMPFSTSKLPNDLRTSRASTTTWRVSSSTPATDSRSVPIWTMSAVHRWRAHSEEASRPAWSPIGRARRALFQTSLDEALDEAPDRRQQQEPARACEEQLERME